MRKKKIYLTSQLLPYHVNLVGFFSELGVSIGKILQDLALNQHVVHQVILGKIGPLLLVFTEGAQKPQRFLICWHGG